MQPCLDSKQRIVDLVRDGGGHSPENCLSFGGIQSPLRFHESCNILNRSTQLNNPPFRVLCRVDNGIEVSQGDTRGMAAKLLGDRFARLDSSLEPFLNEVTVIGMHYFQKFRNGRDSTRWVTVKQAKHLRGPRAALCCQVQLPPAELGALLGRSEVCFPLAKPFQHDLPCSSK